MQLQESEVLTDSLSRALLRTLVRNDVSREVVKAQEATAQMKGLTSSLRQEAVYYNQLLMKHVNRKNGGCE